MTDGLIYPVTRVGQMRPWRSTSPTWPAGSRDFQSHLVLCAGTEHVQRNDKGFSMHPWQEKGLHWTFEKWRWAIIIRFNYSLELHIKLTQARTHTQAATNLLPVAAEKMPWSKWRASHQMSVSELPRRESPMEEQTAQLEHERAAARRPGSLAGDFF